jgi:PEP-CTERM motif
VKQVAPVLLFSAFVCLATNANANVVLLDDFSSIQGTVVTTTNPAPQSTTAGNRTIRITTTAPSPLSNTFVNVAAVSGPTFSISNPSLTTSTVELIYALGANAALLGASTPAFIFDVISRDRQSSVAVDFNGSTGSFSLAAAAIPAAPPAALMFAALTPAQSNLLALGGNLKFTFSGVSDYDLTIDNLRVSLPVPGSLALLGLGLIGFAAARNKK